MEKHDTRAENARSSRTKVSADYLGLLINYYSRIFPICPSENEKVDRKKDNIVLKRSGITSYNICCLSAGMFLPFGFQGGCHQSSPLPTLILPTVVFDLYVNVIKHVESVLLDELGLKKICRPVNLQLLSF